MATVKALVAVGGSRWTKGTMDRVYFNNLSEWFGLQTERYHTGNISSASLNGKPISNSLAREYDIALSSGKVWYDVTAGKWFSQNLDQSEAAVIIRNIKARLAELPAEAQS